MTSAIRTKLCFRQRSREARVLREWERRQAVIFDERWPGAHRLTCLNREMTGEEAVGQLSATLDGVLASGVTLVVLDLRRVRAANSQLVACLVRAERESRERGIRLVVHTSECMRRWIEVCRVDRMIERAAAARQVVPASIGGEAPKYHASSVPEPL